MLEILREHVLKKVNKKKNESTVFVITYNPALPSISGILKKHWRVMSQDPYLKQVFPAPLWLLLGNQQT